MSILDICKTAEKHWSRPVWLCKIFGWNGTKTILQSYFFRKHKEYWHSKDFECLWLAYRTTKNLELDHLRSRKERLQAIRNVIKDLGNER